MRLVELLAAVIADNLKPEKPAPSETAPPLAEEPNARASYEQFLLAEYDHIAKAHFNTGETISTFFKHYLVLLSLPLTGALIALRVGPALTEERLKSLSDHALLVPIAATFIGFLGWCVMAYVINLRLDALLYARTVNGVRRYFSDASPIDTAYELRIRVLPRSITEPKYGEKFYFGPVVIAFGLLNTIYPTLGAYWYINTYKPEWSASWVCAAIAVIGLVGHYFTYYFLGRRREDQLIRRPVIGVDIDGVLNQHRHHFAHLLSRLHAINVDPQQFTVLPVHEHPSLEITEEHADAVFNHPTYWSDMPVAPGAVKALAKIKDDLGYEVRIFTHRPWPKIGVTLSKVEKRNLRRLWQRDVLFFFQKRLTIQWLTEKWLEQHGLKYKAVLVEQKSDPYRRWVFRPRNRFEFVRRHRVRVFVEDDLAKAVKLSEYCDLVFLLTHPYNESSGTVLPKNVRRVADWNEILRFLRDKV